MVRTKKHIQKALEFCDRQAQDLDKEQERLTQQQQWVNEQRDILKGAKDYIILYRANEEKVTRRWEKS